MRTLREFGEAWMTYKKVCAAYTSHGKWQWKKSLLSDGQSSIAAEEELKDSLADLAKLAVSMVNALSLSGLRHVVQKVESLAALTARLEALRKMVIAQTRRLEIRVSQMLQTSMQVADDILLDCNASIPATHKK